MTILQRTLITATLVAAIGTGIYESRQASRLRQENQALQRQQACLSEQIQQLQSQRDDTKRLRTLSAKPSPHLPTLPMQFTNPPATPVEDLQPTNLYARFKDKQPALTAEQVEAYLKANGRQAPNLLAAYRTSGDAALLKKAMEKYPNDPQVAFEAIFAKDVAPEQRRQWLNAFEQNAPDNALANWLSARDFLKTGQTDQAIQELMAASTKRQFQDYTYNRMQDDEEAYLAAGYSIAEAKVVSFSQLGLPQLAQLKELGVQMVDVANAYRNAGDAASAQVVLQMAVGLGQNYSAVDCALGHLVGLTIERIGLDAMNPNSPYGDSGYTVREVSDQLRQQKTQISTLFNETEALLERVSDQDWISYIDREKSFGEEAAMRWVVSKYGQR